MIGDAKAATKTVFEALVVHITTDAIEAALVPPHDPDPDLDREVDQGETIPDLGITVMKGPREGLLALGERLTDPPPPIASSLPVARCLLEGQTQMTPGHVATDKVTQIHVRLVAYRTVGTSLSHLSARPL